MDIIYTLAEVPKIAAMLAAKIPSGSILTLAGDLGTGKTTLSKSLCANWGVEEDVSSPTFSLINEYKTKDGDTIFHADLYRLKDEDEALAIGIEDYLYSGKTILIEWAEVIEHLLPDNTIHIHIEHIDDTQRKLVFLIH